MLVALALAPSSFACDISEFEAHGVTLIQERYRDRDSIRVEAKAGSEGTEMLGILKGRPFDNGTIQVWLAGEPSSAAAAAHGARGFVGVAFRVARDPSRYEAIYIRPTNGRANDQLRRNHSIQYISQPEFPWFRLRQEAPGQYESYADMQPGHWIRIRLVVSGIHASLFLGSNEQPSLIVNDLKHGEGSGAIALWIGPGTVAHFADLHVRPVRQ